MSDLIVRKIPFEFQDVDFKWNPAHPQFSTVINMISFWVIGLERYFVRSMLDAEKLIKDPEILQEAKLFREQEAQHSSCHRRHVTELIKKYPDLQGSLNKVHKAYDELYERESLAYHLAYAGGLEASFTPVFKMIIDNRQVLFADGDSRVASLNLWHFCEEVEHRSSAIMVYNEVVNSHVYRLRIFPFALTHTLRMLKMLETEFIKFVPETDRYAEPLPTLLHGLTGVSKRDMATSLMGVLRAQMPWHKAETEALPEWSATWFEHWGKGEDMSNFYGKKPAGIM